MKNEVETDSIVHENIFLCGKVFYPCQGTAKFKKKKKEKEKLLLLENERKRNKTESIST